MKLKKSEKIFKFNIQFIHQIFNTINKREKYKMVRGKPGKKKGFKKALVTLKKGQSIDLTLGV